MNNIAVGDDPGYDKAYALIAPSAHDPQDGDERGHYRQLYHEIFKYLNNFDPHPSLHRRQIRRELLE